MANVNNADVHLLAEAASDLNDNDGFNDSDDSGETHSHRPKLVVKLKSKALCEKLERLQISRRVQLNKASNF